MTNTNNRFIENNSQTFCPLCDKKLVGDESHYLFICSFFEKERKRFLPDFVNTLSNDISKYWKELFSLDIKSLVQVSKFIKLIVNYFDSISPSFERSEKINKADIYVLTTKKTKCGRDIVKPIRYR